MKALVYHGPGQRRWEEKPRPSITKPTDAVVRITHTTICGTDLHILKGDVPAVEDGRILGHEGVGVVEEIGDGVSNIQIGDEVLISCITSCGRCDYCKRGLYAHCRDGGWILGHLIDGTQAEYVRIPHADNSLHRLPKDMDRAAAVMLSDILPTGHEIGALNGEVGLGDTVAIVGAGPIGLAALMTSRFYSPARIIMIDPDENRLAMAKQLGASDTIARDPLDAIDELTGGEGVDVAMEAVGIPETFDICQRIVRPGAYRQHRRARQERRVPPAGPLDQECHGAYRLGEHRHDPGANAHRRGRWRRARGLGDPPLQALRHREGLRRVFPGGEGAGHQDAIDRRVTKRGRLFNGHILELDGRLRIQLGAQPACAVLNNEKGKQR